MNYYKSEEALKAGQVANKEPFNVHFCTATAVERLSKSQSRDGFNISIRPVGLDKRGGPRELLISVDTEAARQRWLGDISTVQQAPRS